MPFYFRINRVKIIDNKTTGFWFFSRDLADIKLVSFVTTGDQPLPDMTAYATYAKEVVGVKDVASNVKRELAAAMVAQVVNSRILARIDEVKDNQTITFGDTGYVLFRSDKIPQDINWCMMAVVDEQDVRNVGQTIQDVLNAPGFNEFADGLSVLVNLSGNPAYAAGVAVVRFVAQATAAIIKNKSDELAGLLYMSLDQREHYPHGERKSDGVPDLTNNMFVDYSIFGFDEVPPADSPTSTPKGIRNPVRFHP